MIKKIYNNISKIENIPNNITHLIFNWCEMYSIYNIPNNITHLEFNYCENIHKI